MYFFTLEFLKERFTINLNYINWFNIAPSSFYFVAVRVFLCVFNQPWAFNLLFDCEHHYPLHNHKCILLLIARFSLSAYCSCFHSFSVIKIKLTNHNSVPQNSRYVCLIQLYVYKDDVYFCLDVLLVPSSFGVRVAIIIHCFQTTIIIEHKRVRTWICIQKIWNVRLWNSRFNRIT